MNNNLLSLIDHAITLTNSLGLVFDFEYAKEYVRFTFSLRELRIGRILTSEEIDNIVDIDILHRELTKTAYNLLDKKILL